MRVIISYAVACLLVVAMIGTAQAAESDLNAQDTLAIQTVIQGQLDAFRDNDEHRAWSYATPRIHAMFGTPANFMDMVVMTYTIVYRHDRAVFLDLKQIQDSYIQKVLFIAEDGAQVYGLYTMQKQKNGSWLIGGCVLVGAKGDPV